VGKVEGKRRIGRPRSMGNIILKWILVDIGCGGIDLVFVWLRKWLIGALRADRLAECPEQDSNP
jgi:hypothetical protein